MVIKTRTLEIEERVFPAFVSFFFAFLYFFLPLLLFFPFFYVFLQKNIKITQNCAREESLRKTG